MFQFSILPNLKVETLGSADGLDVSYQRNREVRNTSSLVVLAYVEGSTELSFSKIRKTDKELVFVGSGCEDLEFSFW